MIIALLFSLGAINALIPILIILILLVAAAGLNRGYSLFNFFGLATLAGINPGGKASIAGKTGFGFAGSGFVGGGGRLGSALGLGRRLRARIGKRATRGLEAGAIMGMATAGKGAKSRRLPDEQVSFRHTPITAAYRKVLKPTGRAVFMDKPKTTAKKAAGKIAGSKLGKGVKGAYNAVKPKRLKSSEVSIIRTPITAATRRIGNARRAITNPPKGTIRDKIKNPETKAGKILKTMGKAAAVSVAGTPFAGAAYLTIKAGKAMGARRGALPGTGAASAQGAQKRLEAEHALLAKHPHIAKLKSDSMKMGKDIAFIASPALFVASRVKAAARKPGEIREGARENATKQLHKIESRSKGGLSTERERAVGNMERQDTMAHGRALKAANEYLQSKSTSNPNVKSIADLTPKERREMRKIVTSELKKADIKSYGGGTNRTIFTAVPRGVANLVNAGREGGVKGVGRRIRENVVHAGESNESIATAKVARAIPDLIFIAKVSKTEGRDALVSDEARKAAGLKPFTDRQKDILMAHQELDIMHSRNPAALNQHLDRIDRELDVLTRSNPVVLAEGASAAPKPGPKGTSNEDLINELTQQKASIIQHKFADIEPDRLAKLADHPDERIRASVAQNKNTDEKTLVKLAEDKSDAVRNAALGNERIPIGEVRKKIEEHKERLNAQEEREKQEIEKRQREEIEKSIKDLKSSINDLNSKLIKHKDVDEKTLSELADDADKGVSKAAKDRLKEKFGKSVS